MNNSSRSYQTDELLGEIMGFLPKNLLDEYYNNMNVMPAHYKGLEQNFAEESEDIIENELNLMQQQILAKEKELEKLERYEEFISHVICIPEQETYTIPLSLIQTMKRNLDELKQSTMASIMTSRDVARNIRDMDTRSQYLRESLKRQLDVFLIPQAKRSKQDGS
ncbi:hypothetical protein K501DRAFT_278365 [Backusella circina FSU 941]|nr:hypothetical protein K501DRAFT_278365 [Backusella circina FSU 941]